MWARGLRAADLPQQVKRWAPQIARLPGRIDLRAPGLWENNMSPTLVGQNTPSDPSDSRSDGTSPLVQPGTDPALVVVGGFSFCAMFLLKDTDPYTALGVSSSLVASLRSILAVPTGVKALRAKWRRFKSS